MNDHTESLEIAGRLRESVQSLHNLADKAGEARQVREFSSDRRKNLLAKFMYPFLRNGDSAAKAECAARTQEGFLSEMKQLEDQHLEAEKILAKVDAEKCRYEAARSLLSFSKTVKDDLQG